MMWSTGSSKGSPVRPDRVGRDGFLRLSFERRRERTVLAESRFTLPLQASEPMALERSGSVCLMLLNPTGGVVGGDRLRTEIILGPRTHVILTTPSATKIYRTTGPPAILETSIRLGEGAILEYLPDHTIPYPGSALHQCLAVEMEKGGRLILCDSLATGRPARDERWRFSELVCQTSVSMEGEGRPFFIDRASISPQIWAPEGPGGMDGAGYMATFLICAPGFQGWQGLASPLAQWLGQNPWVRGGISPLSRDGHLVRLLCSSGYELAEALQGLWTLARRGLLDLPGLDLRKG